MNPFGRQIPLNRRSPENYYLAISNLYILQIFIELVILGGAIYLLQATDADKNLPLHLAIENGHLDLVEWCIERGKKAGLLIIGYATIKSVNKIGSLFQKQSFKSLRLTWTTLYIYNVNGCCG